MFYEVYMVTENWLNLFYFLGCCLKEVWQMLQNWRTTDVRTT